MYLWSSRDKDTEGILRQTETEETSEISLTCHVGREPCLSKGGEREKANVLVAPLPHTSTH